MHFFWIVLVLGAIASGHSYPLPGAADEEISPISPNRFPRQADQNTTTTSSSSSSSSTPVTDNASTTDAGGSNDATTTEEDLKSLSKGSKHLVGILSGTLVAMFVLVVGVSGLAVVAFLWGCKMNHRRRQEKALVDRTKHDIFEGVPNALSKEEGSEAEESQLRCVLSSDGGPLGGYDSEVEVEVEVGVEREEEEKEGEEEGEVLASGIPSGGTLDGSTLGSDGGMGACEETNV